MEGSTLDTVKGRQIKIDISCSYMEQFMVLKISHVHLQCTCSLCNNLYNTAHLNLDCTCTKCKSKVNCVGGGVFGGQPSTISYLRTCILLP